MNFVDMLMYYGRANPEKQAIILSDRIVSFGMLASAIRSVEKAILQASISKRDVVAILIKNQIRHLLVVSALYRLGIVSVSVVDYPNQLNITAIITDEVLAVANPVRVVRLAEDWFTRPFDADEPRPVGFEHDDALARIIMSSGTTAVPKPIGMSARVIEDRIITGRRTLSIAPWDRMMCLPHIASSLGFGSTLQALAYGHSLVIAESPDDALKMIALYAVDLLVANPDFLKGMVRRHRETPIPTPTLKLIKFGGAAISPDLIPEVRQRLCKDILCVYSSTESGPIAFGTIDRILEEPGSTGFLAPWADVEVVGPDNNPVGTGTEGRLRVKSKWQGYNLKEGPDAASRWIYTGDIGKLSANGMLSLIGRADDAITIDGQFVTPEQLEQELSGYPDVQDVAVVTMAQPHGQNEFWAAIVGAGKLDEPAIVDFLLSKNPRWRLAQIRFVEKIERNRMGKIMRRRVKETLVA
jgi:acyl-coenzyme A synthetase/AMP-(fatty) acid ligase